MLHPSNKAYPLEVGKKKILLIKKTYYLHVERQKGRQNGLTQHVA